ncbi:GntR family transcriptional regulator [Streptomyces sp. NBC_00631]|uniref:GntR family transcriptional regulator n=1 Tax=Streptomyces sp. NBC_00631 TaxID=2975793 RepID=UPI0038653010
MAASGRAEDGRRAAAVVEYALREQLADGTYLAGQRLPTQRELSAESDVSGDTVQRVLRKRRPRAYRPRVGRAAAASCLRAARSPGRLLHTDVRESLETPESPDRAGDRGRGPPGTSAAARTPARRDGTSDVSGGPGSGRRPGPAAPEGPGPTVRGRDHRPHGAAARPGCRCRRGHPPDRHAPSTACTSSTTTACCSAGTSRCPVRSSSTTERRSLPLTCSASAPCSGTTVATRIRTAGQPRVRRHAGGFRRVLGASERCRIRILTRRGRREADVRVWCPPRGAAGTGVRR